MPAQPFVPDPHRLHLLGVEIEFAAPHESGLLALVQHYLEDAAK